ncbi:MAG: MCE family protein [Desulfovibrio sp.]|nr:MAG: MCE family protein [Desulfovibrio sp.]
MPRNSQYFKLGLFILVGIGLLTAALILLGTGSLFEESIPAETYFNESVQGLDIGAPVKFRGVVIGRVSNIDFIINKYEPRNGDGSARYVLVEIALDGEAMNGFSAYSRVDVKVGIQNAIRQGLRVRLTTQGLTGVAYLEMDFFDPARNPELPISWTPRAIYFPSAPSTMSRIEAAINTIGNVMEQLKGANVEEFAESLDQFFKTLNKSLEEADVETIGQLVIKSLEELHGSLERVNTLLDAPEAENLIPDAAGAAASARRTLEGSEENFIKTVEEMYLAAEQLKNTMQSLDQLLASPEMEEAAATLPSTFENVNAASEEIRRASIQLERLMRGLNDLVSAQDGDVESILDEIQVILDNLSVITEDATQNPARLLFGEPPAAIDPEELP